LGDRLSTFNLAGIGHAQVVVPWAEKDLHRSVRGDPPVALTPGDRTVEYVKLGRKRLEVSRICLGRMSYGVSDRGNHAGASTRRSDIRRSGRERVSSSYPTTHRRAA
jgi:hypothetical protein